MENYLVIECKNCVNILTMSPFIRRPLDYSCFPHNREKKRTLKFKFGQELNGIMLIACSLCKGFRVIFTSGQMSQKGRDFAWKNSIKSWNIGGFCVLQRKSLKQTIISRLDLKLPLGSSPLSSASKF